MTSDAAFTALASIAPEIRGALQNGAAEQDARLQIIVWAAAAPLCRRRADLGGRRIIKKKKATANRTAGYFMDRQPRHA